MRSVIGFDTETELIEPGLLAPPLVCYSIASQGKSWLHRWDEKSELYNLWKGAADGRYILLGHSVAYDAAVCCAQYPDMISIIFDAYTNNGVEDTGIREMLLSLEKNGNSHWESLADLSRKHLGIMMSKGEDTWRLRYGELRNNLLSDWPEDAKRYALLDAEVLPRIYQEQENKKLHEDTFANSFDRARGAFAFYLMACHGLKTDVEKVNAVEIELNQLQVERKSTLIESGIMRDKGSVDTKKLIEFLEGEEIILPLTDKGNKSLKTEFLETLDIPLIDTYIDYKHDNKMLNTYIEKYRSGLVQCSVNPLLANGRMSLTKPSLQNLPRSGNIRSMFVARDGKYFASIDYDCIELRTFAQTCLWNLGFSDMAEAFRRDPDADLHVLFAAKLLNIPIEEAQELKKKNDPVLKDARQRAKAANFGYPGGMGPRRFVSTQRSQKAYYTIEEAQDLKNNWIDQWSEAKAYLDFINDLMDYDKRTNIKQFISNRYRGNCTFCQAANGFFSSLMADGSVAATFEIAKECYTKPESILYGARIVNAVHDELIVEVDQDGAHEQSMRVADIMCQVMHEKYTPDIPITATPSLMKRWYKKAEPVYDANKRLTLWEPK